MLPPHKQRTRNDTLSLGPMRKRLNSDREYTSLSLPWPDYRHHHIPSQEFELDPSSNLSPLRKRRAQNNTSTQIGRESEDLSPLWYRKHHHTPSLEYDISLSRSSRFSYDLSPPWNHGARNDTSSPSRFRKDNVNMPHLQLETTWNSIW